MSTGGRGERERGGRECKWKVVFFLGRQMEESVCGWKKMEEKVSEWRAVPGVRSVR